MIDGDKLAEMIGHASIKSPLDDYLLSKNINRRPKGDSGYYHIEENSLGLDFFYKEYENYKEKYLITPKSTGEFILQCVIFRKKLFNKKDKPFEGKLPFHLAFNTEQKHVRKLFSNQVKFSEGDVESADTYTFLAFNKLIDVDYTHQTDLIECVSVRAPSKIDRERGLIN